MNDRAFGGIDPLEVAIFAQALFGSNVNKLRETEMRRA
jgi:hypothetical protein